MKPSPALEKVLYLAGMVTAGTCGLLSAVFALLGLVGFAVALIGLAVLSLAVALTVEGRRLRRFVGVAVRRTGGRGRGSGPAAALSAPTNDLGREAMAALTRINRQLVTMREEGLGDMASTPVPTDREVLAEVGRGQAELLRELAVLRAEVAHLAGRPAQGPQA